MSESVTAGRGRDGGVLGPHFQATIPSVLQNLAETAPERTLVRTVAGESLTAVELWRRAQGLAGALAELGGRPGERVAVDLPNGLEMIEVFFGATLAGCVFVPLNTAWRRRSLARILADSEPAVLVGDASHLDELKDYARSRPQEAQVILVGPADTDADAIEYGSLGARSLPSPAVEVEATSLGVLLYTSGTTGLSKGNMLSHRASLWMAATAAQTLDYSRGDIVHTCLPLFHANALQCGLLASMLGEAEFVIAPRFSASGFWDEVRDCGATHTALLGSMMPLLAARPPVEHDREHSVHTAYCAPLPENLEQFERRFGLKCASTYGLTDANILTVRPADDSGVRSCGVASGDWELALVDGSDLPVGPGEVGELVGRPRLPFIASSGYWRKPDATAELWRNLWCHSGDLLRQDEQGRFHFIDRKKDAIRKGGENVSTFEVEEALLTHPGIAEAAVIGVPSELSEDDVMAFVVLAGSAEVAPREILTLCARELPFFAVPRYIEFTSELPRTENHRVQKAALRERGVSDRTWDAGPLNRRRVEEMAAE
ncbi:MAG TPA: AMP-binding protein [Polyangia bacterium]|nr:AMP-binding protein [Polyangia bacterium]